MELVAEVGQDKWSYTPPVKNETLMSDVNSFLGSRLADAVNNPDKVMRMEGTNDLEAELREHSLGQSCYQRAIGKNAAVQERQDI